MGNILAVMLSFWERESFLPPQDFVVIGAGIVGLSTALELRKLHPAAKIAIVERGPLPLGASTRNAGFACFGSASELLKHEAAEGTESMLSLVELRHSGLELLKKNLYPAAFDYEASGNDEVFRQDQSELYESCLANLDRLNGLIENRLGIRECYRPNDARIDACGFQNVAHLIHNRGEGMLDSGKLISGLIRLLRAQNVNFLFGFNVAHIGEGELVEETGLSMQVGKAIVTTNAFTASLLQELAAQLRPGRGQVVITHPIANLKLRGAFHMEEGYFYFRNVGNRVLLGGGRHLDFDGETTTAFELTSLIQERLEALLSEMILPGVPHEIDLRWSGIMCFGPEIAPIIRQVRPGVICAVRMSGMGVAIGSWVGQQAAALASG